MDIVSYLPLAMFGLHVVLWLAALGMLAPYLRRRGARGRTIHWLVALLIVGGFGTLIGRAIYGQDLLAGSELSGQPWSQPGLAMAADAFGMMMAGALVAMAGSGYLARENALFDETEAALQAAEAGYRAVIDGAVDGIYGMTPGGRLIRANHAYAKILGYDSPGDCLAATAKGTHYVRPERQAELISAAIKDGAVYRFESELHRRDGGTIWVSESVRAIADSQGKIRQLEGVVQDISDRRRAREELKLAAAVFDAAGNGILVTNKRNVIVAANPAFLDATGYAPEDLIGQQPHMLDAGRHDRAFTLSMRRALGASGAWRGTVWLRLKSGEVQQSDLSIVVVRGADGRIARYIAVYGGRAIPGLASSGAPGEPARDNAHYDALTGLSNRWLFQSRLGQSLGKAQGDEKRVAVFAVDIDHFKFVNDSLGHAAGDLLIQEVSRRLLGTLRKQDIVARLGGDEFGIIVPEVDEPSDLIEMGQRILAAMAEPFRINGEEIFATVSIGIAIGPSHGRDAEELMRSADTAMFHAKDQGRNNMQLYSDKLNTRAAERLKIEGNLRRAVERNEFTLNYQPQIDIASRRIIGAEALIRWHRPEEGWISPGRFIPVAEETGLIVQIGDWALREACRQIKSWTDSGSAPRRVSVNLSFKQFRQPNFLNAVERAILDSGVDPNRLELELTESMVMHDVDTVIQVLKRIKALGIEIAIDDFGTGYSSLSHIRRLPIDTIKIDRSFVKEVTTSAGDAEIATAIVALAHSLNLKVIAEGVETAEQLGFLSSRRCDSFQGFLASPAVPADKFLTFQAEWHDRIERTSA